MSIRSRRRLKKYGRTDTGRDLFPHLAFSSQPSASNSTFQIPHSTFKSSTQLSAVSFKYHIPNSTFQIRGLQHSALSFQRSELRTQNPEPRTQNSEPPLHAQGDGRTSPEFLLAPMPYAMSAQHGLRVPHNS
jgi:hypothetical protein